jgi:hypothetical protein
MALGTGAAMSTAMGLEGDGDGDMEVDKAPRRLPLQRVGRKMGWFFVLAIPAIFLPLVRRELDVQSWASIMRAASYQY